MIRVHSPRAPAPTWFCGTVRVVLADLYAHLDEGEGAIVRDQIREQDILHLDAVPPGVAVFVESERFDDVLDDTDSETEAATRIWWRATVMLDPPSSGNAEAQGALRST